MDSGKINVIYPILVGLVFAVLLWLTQRREHMGGYGTISGLYWSNNGNKYCWHNPYDPPGFMYCGISSKVVQ